MQKECIEAKKAKQVAQTKHGKQHCTGRRRVCIKQTGIMGMHLTSGYTPIGHERDGYNHTRTSPRGAQSMGKPRSREASIYIKHRSKQTYTCI